ncbi:MAG: LysR family transcriptional regulator [Kofleriaceae bacterium]|nr:LysR family transcriptional regulator [Kofleriaceae bacterium]
MDWLNYHHLLYFWTVAKSGGLAPASKQLRISQSALSGQINQLQQSLGQPLFDRRGRRLELNETGRIVYKYAEEIFGLGRELMSTVRGRASLASSSRLTVGISDVVPKLLVRQLIAPVFALSPRPALVFIEDTFERLLDALAAHELDVVIADAPVPPTTEVRAYHHALGESTVSLVAPPGLATTLRRTFPHSLDGAELLLPLPGSTLRRALDAWFTTHGIRPAIIAEAEDSALLKAFAAEGMGAMFVPTVIAPVVAGRYGLTVIAEVPEVREQYFAISAERRLAHPAVVAIRAAARDDVFG